MKRCGFVGLPPQTPLGETVLDREEALKLFDRLEKMGHVHLAFYGFTMSADSPQFVGTCNCCSCCCGIFHGQRLAGVSEGAQKSNYRAVIHDDVCNACGACILRCPVDAIAEGPTPVSPAALTAAGKPPDTGKRTSVVDRDTCIGCGVCVIGCVPNAITMEPVSEEEWFRVPANIVEWEEMRLAHMAAQNDENAAGSRLR